MYKTSVGRLTLGLVLAVLGVALLLDMNYGRDVFSVVVRYWPVALILLGLEYVLASRDPEKTARVSVGSVILIAVVLCVAWAYTESPSSFLGMPNFGFTYPGQQEYVVELPVNEAFGIALTRLSVDAVRDVTVSGSSGSAVAGTAVVIVRSRTLSEAKEIAEQLRIIGRPSGSTLYLEVSRPANLSRFTSIHPSFTISMPEQGSLTSRTVSGDTRVTGVMGDVSVDSISGGVYLDDSPASVSVTLVSGRLSMTLNPETATVSAKTISGDVLINVPAGTGGSLDFTSVSGSLDSSLPGIGSTNSPGRRTASGEFGTGHTAVHINTISGDAVIR